MAQSIGDVIINVEANTQRLVDGFNRAEKTVTQSTKQMKNAVETFAAAYISLDGIVSGAKFFLKQADAMTTVESRLKLVTKGTEDLLKTQKELFEISQNNRVAFTQTADLYQRIARSTNAYNIEQSRVLTLTDSISKAMVIGGGTAESQKNALIQLGQAFSANFKSVGQELASLREQAPRVYEAILAGMNDGAGVTADVFRKMAEDGKLSVEIIIKALEKAAPELAREYEAIAKTFEQGTIQLSNALKQTIKEIDNTFEISSTASDFMTDLSTSLKESTPAIIEFMKAAKENKDVVISLGEAYLAYKASVIAISAVNSAYVPIKQLVTKAKEAETAATLAQAQAEKMSAQATEAKTALEAQSALVTDLKTKSETLSAQASMKSAELEKARIDLKYGLNGATATYVKTLEAEIVALTKEADASLKQSIANEKAIASLNKKAVATEAASLRATEYATKMELASANSGIFATAIGGLGNLLKTFAPIAALTIITEIFMNWDKITGKVKNNLASSSEELAKMSKNQLADQLNQYNQQIKNIDQEISKLSTKSRFSYFGEVSEEEKTAIKARIDALTQEKEKVQDLIKETNKLTEAKTTKKTSFYESVADVSNQVASQARNIEASSKEIAKVLDPFGVKIKDIQERYDTLIKTIESNKNAALGSLKQAELLPDDTKRKKELIDEAKKNADKADKEIIEATKARNKEIADANEEHNKDANKEAEKWAKKKLELLSEISIAEQDELAKPYIKLEQEYQKDLMEFGKTQEAKDLITKDYYAKVEALNKKTVEDFNKKEEEKFKKSVEWQVKLFEANEKVNDQIIAQREKMYGANSDQQIEAWYQNQLEWLGKLALEGKYTAQELQALLDKIDSLKSLKLQEQTLSFKIEDTFYDSFEKNLSSSIENGFDDANLKSFTRSIGKDIWASVSSYGASNVTNFLRGGLSLGALAVGSAVSASEIANIMNSGGTFDSATNTITTSGGSKISVGESGAGTVKKAGSDVMSLVNTISTLKTAYGILSNGLSSYVLSGFQGVSSGLGYLGMTGAASTLGEFGVGFASPWATQAAYSTAQAAGGTAGLYGSGVGEISGSQMAGSYMGGAAIGGALGYGAGWLGDKAFGAKTQASNLGAVGGMVGSYFGPVGTAVGAAVGAIIGGAIGSKKFKDSGVQFLTDAMSDTVFNTDTAISFQDWEKKSWFSKTTGTSTSPLSEDSIKSIKKMFNTYDTLLSYLGDADKIVMKAGKYTPDNLQFHMIKNFLTAFTDVNQDTDETIYNTWYEYAKSINKTITEALQESVNTFVSEKRTFEIWQVGADSIEGLAKKAQFAQEDFDNLAKSLDATGVTVENYLSMYDKAVKESFDPQTIASWKNLGDALMSATDAQKEYTDALSEATAIATAAEDAYRKQILANQATNAKNIDTVFKNLSLQGLTVAQTFKELTGKDAPKTVKEWEAVGEELKKTEQVLSNEILTAFQNIGAELKQAVTNTKLLASSLLNTGDALGALKTLMSLEEFKFSDFMNGDNFNAGAFNVAYARKEMEIASRLASQTSENALSMQNAMQTFNSLSSKIKETALSEYGVLFAENYKNFAYGFAEAATGSKELTSSFNNLVGISNELAKSFAYEQGMAYVPNGQGIATLQNAIMQASIVSQSAYSSRMGKVLYGMEEIAIDKTFATLAGELKRGTISADEYSRSLEFINNEFADTIDLMEDTEAQLKRIADAQYNIWSTAVSSTEFYFTKINEQADAYVATLKETTEGYKGATEAIGRLNSLTEVLAFTSSNINIDGMRNYLGGNPDLTQEAYVKSTATLISSAAKLLSAEITTADAKQAAEAIKQKASFADVDALKIRDLSLAFENLKAYDSTSLEGTLSLLNKELINKSITDAQYVDLFNIGLDVYRDAQNTQEKLLTSINGYLEDIADYQRELLGGDLSPLGAVDKYNYTAQQTAQIAQQAIDAVASGDLENFSTYFNSYKQVSADFLAISKDLSANNATYMNDFIKVYNALENMKLFDQTSKLDYLKIDGSHATGLDYVPFDGYIAELHKGERVQTASEARTNDMLAQEIRLLREDLRNANSALASHTARTARILDKWDNDGMPEVAV